LKSKIAAIGLEREAFKVDQARLKEEVSTMTRSLKKMAEDIKAVRQDMTNMSARFRSDIADLKQLILNMSANKRERKHSKSSEGSSTSLAEKRAKKSMETYDDIAHDMATSWTNMCKSEGEGDTSDHLLFHKAIVHPVRARLGRSDVCITYHG
jgi:peptidoglycan hydrolase CwlO-like protein